MDALEPQSPSQPAAIDLQAQCDGLRQTLNTMLVLLVVVSGTLTIFLVRQWRFAKTDLDMLRPQAEQVINEYNRVSAPAMQEFVRKLADYSKSHPDFTPIAAKYHLYDVSAKAGTNPPSLPTAPAATPSKK